MYYQEDAFKRSAETAHTASSVLCATGLATGILFTTSMCGVDLSEWNVVNGVLCGALAASTHTSLKTNPRILQNAFRLCKREIGVRDLIAEGSLAAALTIGHLALPVMLLYWALSGLSGMGVGACAEASPLFYCVSLAQMLAQVGVILYLAKINLEAAGYNCNACGIQQKVLECAEKAKNMAVDFSKNGYTYTLNATDLAVPVLKAQTEEVIKTGRAMWEARPKYMSIEFWSGPEGRALLRS